MKKFNIFAPTARKGTSAYQRQVEEQQKTARDFYRKELGRALTPTEIKTIDDTIKEVIENDAD